MSDLPAVIDADSGEAPRFQQGGGIAVRSMDDLARMAGAVAKSGMFKDANTPERAAVKMMFAMAMGFEPITGLTGVDIIDGNPTPNAHFWAAALESHPRYDYQVITSTDEACEILFLRDGRPRGSVTWTMADAKRAGLAGKGNWSKYPRAMLYARAMTEGGRMYAPQLFGGIRAYTPEELGGDPGAGAPPPDAGPVAASIETESVAANGVPGPAQSPPVDAGDVAGDVVGASPGGEQTEFDVVAALERDFGAKREEKP